VPGQVGFTCDILIIIHSSNNATANPTDRLAKLRPLMEIIQENIRLVYVPEEETSIDESLWKFKAHLLSHSRGLSQQFWVDMYAKMEAERLNYIKTYQKELRVET
jgi:hypothetical protein